MAVNPFVEEIDFEGIELQGVVGKGSFGTVKKGTWRGLDVAVKMIETEQEKKAFIIEVQQLSRVNHPNIVKLYGACTKTPVCLVMEYAEGGSLYNVLHCMKQVEYSASHAVSWLLQCATGVAYLHNMKPRALIHRDLKPPNLLLVNGGTVLKICDFGTARDKHTNMTNSKGSAAWMAPEVFEGSQYNEKCDIFSWAIILWEVLTRKRPFHDNEGATAFRIMWAIHNGQRPPLIQGCPKPLESLMTRCWDKDPMGRPSMLEVQNEMSYIFKFMKGADQPITFLPQQVNTVDGTPITVSPPKNETASSKTVLPKIQLQMEVPSTYSGSIADNNLLSPDIAAGEKYSKEMKKRRSADLNPSDVKLSSNLGHRRSGSCDSPYLGTAQISSSLAAPTPSEQVQEAENSSADGPFTDFNNFLHLLEPNLQPLRPVQCRESVEIYEKHMNLARELFRCRNETSLLKKRRDELQNQLKDNENSSTYIDKYLQVKREQESLIQLRESLKRQLEIMRSRQPPENNTTADKGSSEEWVMV